MTRPLKIGDVIRVKHLPECTEEYRGCVGVLTRFAEDDERCYIRLFKHPFPEGEQYGDVSTPLDFLELLEDPDV